MNNVTTTARIYSVTACVFALVVSACTTTTTERAETTRDAGPETLVELFDSSQRVPPFNNVARLFDPGVPAADYDAIREIFFREFVEPMIDKSFSRTATWNDFKGKTERPSLGTGTGLHSDAARELVLWFVERDRITIGSSKDDVVRIQGTPDEIGDTKWRYGASNLYFEKDKVTKWDISPLSPLKVILRPSGSAPSKRGFAAGDTKDEVFRAQGPPTSFSESTWKYRDSAVLFDHGRVARFEDSPSTPLHLNRR